MQVGRNLLCVSGTRADTERVAQGDRRYSRRVPCRVAEEFRGTMGTPSLHAPIEQLVGSGCLHSTSYIVHTARHAYALCGRPDRQ